MNSTRGYKSSGLFLDNRNAFDMVDHALLLAKLESVGIRSVLHIWFESYLQNRVNLFTLEDQ